MLIMFHQKNETLTYVPQLCRSVYYRDRRISITRIPKIYSIGTNVSVGFDGANTHQTKYFHSATTNRNIVVFVIMN